MRPILRRRCRARGTCPGIASSDTQQVLTAAISGAGPVDDAGPDLWSDLPVLPFIQPAAVFAVAESLQPVLQRSQDGWVWTSPLAGLSSWPVT